ncbi:MAG: hypothetical protein LBO20_03795 [Bifidobacteriaceae bacterium]|jgi:hypothetical protein|nr:hypothetical protein [Bifidobacteriaceae bacterium]
MDAADLRRSSSRHLLPGRAGPVAASGVVRTGQPFERSLAEFTKLVGDA